MAVETDAERALVLDPAEFGVEAAYTPRGGGASRPVAGIFDEPGTNWNPSRWPGGHPYAMQEGAHIESTAPTFECRVSDLVDGGQQGDGLVIGGVTFRVFGRKPDGTGFIVLTLEEVLEADEEEP